METIGEQKYSRLLTTDRDKFIPHMDRINAIIDHKINSGGAKLEELSKQQTKDDIDKCNRYAQEINREIAAIVKFIKKVYSQKLP